jgi:hypothetical protein
MIRGTALLATRAYLEKKHGAGAFDRAVLLLRPEHAAVWRAIPLAHEWYSHEAVLALDDAAASLYGPDFYDEIGAFVADYDLNFIHRFLLKFTSPLWILDKGAKMWSEFYNSGKWSIVRGTQPKSLVGTLENFAIVSVRQCRMVTAFVRKAGELTGAHKIKVEHPQCRARGSSVCVFTAAW